MLGKSNYNHTKILKVQKLTLKKKTINKSHLLMLLKNDSLKCELLGITLKDKYNNEYEQNSRTTI